MSHEGQAASCAQPTSLPGFLTLAESRDIIGEIERADQAQAQIWTDDGFDAQPQSRRGAIAQLTQQTEALVHDRLWSAMPDLERRFDCAVSHLSAITALIYGPGDHFAAHSDGGLDDDAPPEVRRRRVSLVIALNDGAREFSGGELQLYPGLAPGSEPRPGETVHMRSQPGLLIAFGSAMVHRVMPVIAGRRYSLALWALAPS